MKTKTTPSLALRCITIPLDSLTEAVWRESVKEVSEGRQTGAFPLKLLSCEEEFGTSPALGDWLAVAGTARSEL